MIRSIIVFLMLLVAAATTFQGCKSMGHATGEAAEEVEEGAEEFEKGYEEGKND